MNANDFTSLLNNPTAISDQQLEMLDKIVAEFPYFQSAKALQLKALHNLNSFKYNQALKITAAYTTDRNVLFEFITSDEFELLQNNTLSAPEIVTPETKEIPEKTAEVLPKAFENKLEQSILTSIIEATVSETTVTEKIINDGKTGEETTIEEKLEIGQPLPFSKEEKHSFQEWLQLATIQPINRTEETPIEKKETDEDLERKKKLDLIDKFIEANPKITPVKNSPITPIITEQTSIENSYLMTETLAKVYLEQKKYQKAIQAYEILILKYPEKFSFFAGRIADIKTLQQNNN